MGRMKTRSEIQPNSRQNSLKSFPRHLYSREVLFPSVGEVAAAAPTALDDLTRNSMSSFSWPHRMVSSSLGVSTPRNSARPFTGIRELHTSSFRSRSRNFSCCFPAPSDSFESACWDTRSDGGKGGK